MQYRITATLGPASDHVETWRGLLSAGCSAFRINTSHLTVPDLEELVDRLRRFLQDPPCDVPVILDLQASKWRLGEFPTCRLMAGQQVDLLLSDHAEGPGLLPVPHEDFFRAAAAEGGGDLFLNDAKIRVAIESIAGERVRGRVLAGGEISRRKGLSLPGATIRIERLSDRDQQIVRSTAGIPRLGYAISFVKDAQEMATYRSLFGSQTYLIAKLERPSALKEAAEMTPSVDALWLCRGDLGAEAGLQTMARLVSQFNTGVATLTKPVHLAGQVLEHTTHHPQPTRSEVCHLYDMLRIGYQGIVLSDETAVGRYPVESCRSAAMFREPATV